ncbi:MAG: N-6 DNA methylase [Bacteroidales bacterium]|nr:N-6 DNA methylase [Bacteroidales bacterium]
MGRPRKNPDQPKAPAKPRKKAKPVEKQKALEDILYECRNKLRGNANMTTKRDMLLTLVFLRFIGSRYNEQREKILQDSCQRFGKPYEELSADERDFVDMMLQRKQSYQKDGVFCLKDEYNWDVLNKIPAADRATKLDNGISALMSNEKDLKNALPTNLFVNARLDPALLKGVMDDITKIDPRIFKDIDLIGRVYEYFLQQFAVNATKEEGEFYTPQSIVELIANLIEPFDGTIYDPCCGSGGMFVQSIKLVEAHGGNKRNVSVYGQESDPDTYRLAKMNLAARGISYHLGDRHASSFTSDLHPGLRSDYIMANPPFNKKDWWTGDDLSGDNRWKGYAVPPTSNANYAWILHMLYHLDQTKGIAGFLLSNGALDDEDTIEIRKKLIKNDKVEAIFILPRDMFYQVDLGVTLWILNQNKKGGEWHGRQLRDRSGEVLFVDLRKWNQNSSTIKTDKSKKTFVVFDEKQIQDVCTIYHDWQTQSDGNTYDKPELYHAASKEEIANNNWSLIPSKYIRFKAAEPKYNLEQSVKEANQISSSILGLESYHQSIIQELQNALNGLSLNNCYPEVEIGKYLIPSDKRNDQLLYGKKDVVGLSTSKEVIKTKANLEGASLASYKVFEPKMIAYVPDTSRRGDRVSLGMNKTESTFLLSSISEVFSCDEEHLLPEYLYMWLSRSEFDRYARFNSWGTTRETFTFEEMKKVKMPLPPTSIQKAIVNIFHCAEEAKRIAEQSEKLSKEICPSLMQSLGIGS